ncbi:MAG: glycosyltransferase, partial [Bacteroidetes bacterium]
MLKVLHIRSSFDPGGTETLLLNTFNQSQSFFRMYLVLLKDGTLIQQLDEKNGNRYYKWFRKRFLDFSVLRSMNKLIRQQDIKIIHSHQFIELIYATLLKIMNPKIKVVHQIHLLFERRNLVFYLEKYISSFTARVLTVSKTARNILLQDYGFTPGNISVVYNGIKDIPAPKGSDHHQSLQPDPAKFNVLMVANFVFGKDHRTLLKAYDLHIRGKMPDVCFYFVGRQTAISEKLKKTYLNEKDLAEKRINFCGAIPNSRQLLGSYDLAVMSCVSETFNIALAEAVFANKKVLASDIPVFRELSAEGKYFHLFKTGNPDDFFEQLSIIRQNNKVSEQTNNTKPYK